MGKFGSQDAKRIGAKCGDDELRSPCSCRTIPIVFAYLERINLRYSILALLGKLVVTTQNLVGFDHYREYLSCDGSVHSSVFGDSVLTTLVEIGILRRGRWTHDEIRALVVLH